MFVTTAVVVVVVVVVLLYNYSIAAVRYYYSVSSLQSVVASCGLRVSLVVVRMPTRCALAILLQPPLLQQLPQLISASAVALSTATTTSVVCTNA